MSKLKTILISILAVLAIALSVVMYIFWQRSQIEPNGIETITDSTEQAEQLPSSGLDSNDETIDEPSEPVPTIPPPPINPLRHSLEWTAKQYAERLGSFSSHANFANLVSLKPLSTENMNTWIDETIENYANESLTGVSFIGNTTRALVARTVIFDEEDGKAIIEVDTQRKQRAEGVEEKIYYQEITIELLKSGDQWLVDGAFWGEIK